MREKVDESGLPVVLLLNAGGPVELTGLLDGMQHLDAILQLSQLGQQGGQAVADVLLGRAVPEGKLTATWARRYDDIPCARAFGSLNGDVSQDTYRDGVYVGYRYFDSFGVRPLFAFGFRLSYTTIALRAAVRDVQPGHLAVQVEVANTGARSADRRPAAVRLRVIILHRRLRAARCATGFEVYTGSGARKRGSDRLLTRLAHHL